MDIPVVIESRAWFNPNLISRIAFVPGVIAIVVMLVSLMLTAMAVVREKELGTLEQVMVTPIKPLEFMLGKTVPFVISPSSMSSWYLCLPYFGLTCLFGVVLWSYYWGLWPSCLTRLAWAAYFHSFLNPTASLDGRHFSVDAGYSPFRSDFPHRQYAQAFSIHYLCESFTIFHIIVQGIFLKGVGLANLWPEMVAMTLMGMAMMSLSVYRFQRRLH